MLRIPDRNIALIGMNGCGKHAIGKAFAEKLGHLYFDVLNRDHTLWLNTERIVYVPEDVSDMDFITLYSMPRMAMVIFIDVPFEVLDAYRIKSNATWKYTQTEDELRKLYTSMRPIYERWAHKTIIAQQKVLDIDSAVEVLIKMFESYQSERRDT